MQENRSGCRDAVCIDCNRVLDSCRDKDCYENAKVYLTGFGQGLIEKTNNIRCKDAQIVCCQIGLDDVPFHCGFYQVTVRLYTKLELEACVCLGNPQPFSGVAVTEKKVILYGSEGNVSIFQSNPNESGFCKCANPHKSKTNLPVAVCEVAEPVVLDVRVQEPSSPCCCCCCAADLQQDVSEWLDGYLVEDEDGKFLTATLGFFSVVRIERPGQYIVNATENSVPEKECIVANENDPCALFRSMDFPISQFAPPPFPRPSCGCDHK